jgi:hypothetical protein
VPDAADIDFAIADPSSILPPVCPPAEAIVLISEVILGSREVLTDNTEELSAARDPFICAEQERNIRQEKQNIRKQQKYLIIKKHTAIQVLIQLSFFCQKPGNLFFSTLFNNFRIFVKINATLTFYMCLKSHRVGIP